MKKILMIASALILMLMISSQGLVEGDQTRGNLDYYDVERDVDDGGIDDSGAMKDIDITSISLDDSSDPIVIEMIVRGDIAYSSDDYDVSYYFYLDHTGDSNAESTITIQKDDKYITTSYGSGGPSPLTDVSADGIQFLTINLPVSQISGSPGIVGLWAMAQLEDGTSRAYDECNRNFGSTNPPDSEDDPKDATPTDPSISVSIDDFSSSATSDGTSYDFTQGATGTTTGDIVKAYYCVAYYDAATGAGQGSFSWEMGPIDEERTYGGQTYEEEFTGTSSGGSWSTWKWEFHSSGPLDSSNRQQFENPDQYYTGVDIVLYVRVYSSDGWNQDSLDITDEIKGGSSSSDDDDTDDDDDTTDDDTDDDTVDDDDTDDDDDKSPGLGISLLIAVVVMTGIIVGRKRRK